MLSSSDETGRCVDTSLNKDSDGTLGFCWRRKASLATSVWSRSAASLMLLVVLLLLLLLI